MLVIKIIITVVLGYLLGNISCATILSKVVFKKDIRTLGSGNAGTTNVLRNFGLKYAIPVFFGDALKCAGAALLGCLIIGKGFNGFSWISGFSEPYIFIGGVSAIIGHNFPIFMGFKGGKGVACSLGLLVLMNPILGVIFIIIAAIANIHIRLYSLVSMSTMLLSAIVFTIFDAKGEIFEILTLWFMFILMVFMHRENVKRLFNGEEKKIDIFK